MKDKHLFILFFLVLNFFFVNSFLSAQTSAWIRLNTLNGQSAYLADNYLNTHFPNHPEIIAISVGILSPASARTLFQFYYLNSLPSTTNIISATLSFTASPPYMPNLGNYGPNSSYLRRVTTAWNKDSVLWESAPDFTHHNQLLLPQLSAGQGIDIDVTNLVADMVHNPSTNYGLILMQRFEYPDRSMNFVSGANSDTSKRPLLRITFEAPLPVELSSFTSTISGRNTTLNWVTASENNNAGFDVLRSSLNGNTNFTKIGFVKGNGNSKISHSYSYEDNNLASGRYQYKLKQIDYNGNFKEYNLTNDVLIGTPDKYSLYQNYPNPFNPSTKINYDISRDGSVKLILFDESGREMKTLVNEVKSAGYYSADFNGSNLSSGVYFYKLEVQSPSDSKSVFAETKKMMLIK